MGICRRLILCGLSGDRYGHIEGAEALRGEVTDAEAEAIASRRELKLLREGDSVFQDGLILRRSEVEVEDSGGLRRRIRLRYGFAGIIPEGH